MQQIEENDWGWYRGASAIYSPGKGRTRFALFLLGDNAFTLMPWLVKSYRRSSSKCWFQGAEGSFPLSCSVFHLKVLLKVSFLQVQTLDTRDVVVICSCCLSGPEERGEHSLHFGKMIHDRLVIKAGTLHSYW